MKSFSRLFAISLFTLLATFAAGCGSGGGTKIALLLPGTNPASYEEATRHDFEKAIDEACGGCEVLYSNADSEEGKQARQAEAALEGGAAVLVVNPVIPERASVFVKKAKAQGVPVLDYESLVLEAEPDAFVSYDDGKTGALQAEALSQGLKAAGRPEGPIVMLSGEPGNRDQPLFEKGAKTELEAAAVEIAAEDFTPFWLAREARKEMQLAIRKLGAGGFAGVYAETDGIAQGAIEAMGSAGIDPAQVPVTGRDATVHGLQRILEGKQYMTTYQPIAPEAAAAAEIAVALAEGDEVPQGRITDRLDNLAIEVPSILLEPTTITRDDIRQTVVADGFVSTSKLCAGRFGSLCAEAGIRPRD